MFARKEDMIYVDRMNLWLTKCGTGVWELRLGEYFDLDAGVGYITIQRFFP